MWGRPLVDSGGFAHGIEVVPARRVVHGAMHDHVVGGARLDGVCGEDDGAADLAYALEPAQPARLDSELVDEPVGGDGLSPVDDGVSPRRGK